jgi:hypothetical protein
LRMFPSREIRTPTWRPSSAEIAARCRANSGETTCPGETRRLKVRSSVLRCDCLMPRMLPSIAWMDLSPLRVGKKNYSNNQQGFGKRL